MIQKIVNVSPENWPDLAVHLGCSADYIFRTQDIRRSWIYHRGDPRYQDNCCFTKVAVEWGNREEGTGSIPRNWKTVLEVYKKLCAVSDEELSKLALFEEKLIHGNKPY